MNLNAPVFGLAKSLLAGVFVFALAAASFPTHAATLWMGSSITFTEPSHGSADVLIPGKVSLARNAGGPLYNPAAGETGSDFISSPKDTMWAFGSLTNYTNLSFSTFAAIRSAAVPNLSAALTPNKPMVVHLTNEDIYLQLTFTAWPRGQAFGPFIPFSYIRSTPGVVGPAPTVTLTNPIASTVFAAPAALHLGASASVTSGSVTNVAFFANSTLQGSDQTSPFGITSSSLNAGGYSLTAVATAGGVSATSAVVHVTVVNPVATTSSPPAIVSGQFSFNYNANPGLKYVVEKTSDFTNWVPAVTNVPVSSPVPFSEPVISDSWRFYRVTRQPNP